MSDATSKLTQRFHELFGAAGGEIHIIRAPGRVNLIGEHTDYNDGFVFPMAIEPEVRISLPGARRRARAACVDGVCRGRSRSSRSIARSKRDQAASHVGELQQGRRRRNCSRRGSRCRAWTR